MTTSRATQLHVVSGKGGTGKTTVAAAMSLALASDGQRVLLCEVEGRQGIASVFEVAPLPYTETRLVVTRDGGDVYGLAIDAEAALLEYLDMFYRLGRAGKALDRFGVIDFATTIAPGVRDVLLIGKVYEAARRHADDPQHYDAIVLDAPPTGRIGRFLNVTGEVAGIAKVGPIRKQADSIMAMLRSPRTRVHLVSLLEEMPVQETLEAADELHEIGLRLGHLIVNRRTEPELEAAGLRRCSEGTVDRAQVEAELAEVGLSTEPRVIDSLLREAAEHAERVYNQAEQLGRLESSGCSLTSLPDVREGVDLAALYDLAESVRPVVA